MYNLFQVTQTLRSLPVTPYMRGYAPHIAMVSAIAIIGWLLYSHQTTTQNNYYTTTIDEEVCQLRQGHIETACNNNNYITIEISTQNEQQNTSNILTADNITSNTVGKSVEELPTVLDTLVNTISYLKYWLGAGLLMLITAIPWDHSSLVVQVSVDVVFISFMVITTVTMMTFVYTLLKVASSAIDQVLEWVVAPLINIFFDIITNTFVVILTAFFFIEAKLQHTPRLTRVYHQPKSAENVADDDVIDFGHHVPVENDEQSVLHNFRAKPLELSEAEIKEDVDLVQQAWNNQYNNDAGLPPKKKKLQINENKNDIQDIAGREEAEVSIDFLESIRHLIPQLQQAAPAKFEKDSPLELLVRKCNAFHLLDDIFRLEEELHALKKQVKKEKRLEKLEKKLQSDLVGWDVPQGRSRRIRKQRVIFSPTA
jgi:hypothetical protein